MRAVRYVRSLPVAPDGADLAWVTGLCGDAHRAGRELRWLRWAVSRIVAERDAMDDSTAADVAWALQEEVAQAFASDLTAQTAWPTRWAEYAGAVGQRGTPIRLPDRLAAVLLQAVGRGGAADATGAPSPEARARGVVERYRTESNVALREAFGTISLPEHVRPSTLRS